MTSIAEPSPSPTPRPHADIGSYTLAELVDLALYTPEIGAVNFNILRILLHDIVGKLGIDNLAVDLGDQDATHVEKYKDYTGSPDVAPMPGVLQVSQPGVSYSVKTIGGTDGHAGHKEIVAETRSQTAASSRDPSPVRAYSATPAERNSLEEKVGRLEHQLEALYQLPTNHELLENQEGKGSMGVNDMWQIIQLNNRVASCESAIQKMATLFSDMAVDMNGVKGDHKTFKADAHSINQTHSRLSMEFPPLADKCLMVQEALDELKRDLGDIQGEWKRELETLTKLASTMDPKILAEALQVKPSKHHRRHHSQGHIRDRDPSPKSPGGSNESGENGSGGSGGSADSTPRKTEQMHPDDFPQSDRKSQAPRPSSPAPGDLPHSGDRDRPISGRKSHAHFHKSLKPRESTSHPPPTPESRDGDHDILSTITDTTEHSQGGHSGKPRGTESHHTPVSHSPSHAHAKPSHSHHHHHKPRLDIQHPKQKLAPMSQFADLAEVIERMDTIWDAIQIVKTNEETLAVKILRQDAILKDLPFDAFEKMQQIPVETLEALASGKLDKMFSGLTMSAIGNNLRPMAPLKFDSTTGAEKENLQQVYNTLANIMAETMDHRHKVELLIEQVQTLEASMFSKEALIEALNDKADLDQVSTKVSYNDFSTAVDELQQGLRDLIMDDVAHNEHWKTVTEELLQSMSDKLDKNELAPIKAQFTKNFKSFDERLKALQKKIDEPDPAGTRKKLLKDYNCISCDRHCNISGVTNGPRLPTIGPILAAHSTASKRAFDLHRMRIKKKFDHECRDMLVMERQMRSLGLLNSDGSVKVPGENPIVNRYQGGSHTTMTNAALIRASQQQRNSCRLDSSQQNQINCPPSFPPDEEEMEGEGDAPMVSLISDLPGGGDASEVEGAEEMMEEEDIFTMPQEDLEQAEETEELIQSYVPVYVEE